jgi:eukaryotic-like serine/threonine-protein kinase
MLPTAFRCDDRAGVGPANVTAKRDFEPMPLSAGTRLGNYEILALIGAGGMGEVYKARDPRLGRTIALKILPDRLAADPDRRMRFEREAKAIAALSHPNIVTIHSIEDADGLHFLTMEFVAGRTLDAVIGRGLSLDTLLKIAVPLTDAIATAHQNGIMHRDLKPGNIIVGGDGRVRVLDFGLAKFRDVAADAPDAERLTMTRDVTAEGHVIGTAAYMSPEQAEGRQVDERSDIFSLGVVLFEMATGQRPFTGDTSASVIASILRDAPQAVTAIRPQLPAELARIVRRCLVKDPEHRYQTAKDLRNDLEELKQALDSGDVLIESAPGARARGGTRLWWAVGGLAVLVLIATAAAVVTNSRRSSGMPAPIEATFTKLTSQAGIEQHPSLSPDGKWIVYAAQAPAGGQRIFLQSVGGQNPIDLTKDAVSDDTQPVFSPDGEQIAFRSSRQGGGLFVMGRTGEFVRKVSDAGFNPAWSPDVREIAYSTEAVDINPYNRTGTSELWVVTVADGARRQLYKGDAVQPSWSPHNRRIAYWASAANGQRDIFTIPVAGGLPVAVTNDLAVDFSPLWSSDGQYLLFSSDRGGTLNLWRVPLDEATGQARGPAEPLTTNSTWVADVAVSGDGHRVAYAAVTLTSNIQRFDADATTGAIHGAGTWVTTGSAFRRYFDVSPDGERIAFTSGGTQEDLFTCNADGSNMQQLTNDAARDRRPSWSPDGNLIAFESNRGGMYQVWVVNRDASGLRPLTAAERVLYHAWSPSGDRMVVITLSPPALVFDPRRPWKDQQPEQLPPAPFGQFSSNSWSPDGRRLAGWSPRGIATYDWTSRTYEVLTHDRPTYASWLGSDRIVYFVGTRLMLVDLATKTPREVLSTAPDVIRYVVVGRDGRQIYISRGPNEADIWMATIR